MWFNYPFDNMHCIFKRTVFPLIIRWFALVKYVIIIIIILWRLQPNRGLCSPHSWGLFEITHNDTPQSVGLLWTSDQPVAETSTWQHTTLRTNIHATGGIGTHNLSRRAAADPRLRPRGHWNRLLLLLLLLFHKFLVVIYRQKRWREEP